jgi:hypothetical protein
MIDLQLNFDKLSVQLRLKVRPIFFFSFSVAKNHGKTKSEVAKKGGASTKLKEVKLQN